MAAVSARYFTWRVGMEAREVVSVDAAAVKNAYESPHIESIMKTDDIEREVQYAGREISLIHV